MKYFTCLLAIIFAFNTQVNAQVAPTNNSTATFTQPKLTTEEVKIVENAAKNLVFDNSEINPSSFKSLDELATLLVRKPDWKLRISGHTASTGTSTTRTVSNEEYIKKIRDYIEKRGIARDRFILNWGGENSNFTTSSSTTSGRAQNRRVQLSILKN